MGNINVFTGPMKCGKTRKNVKRTRKTINYWKNFKNF